MAPRRAPTAAASPLAGLNPEQRRAAETTEGPLLVLAGAGTGKTKTVTARIAHLLARGTPAEAIIAVTFTNKAAAEMRERVAAAAGAAAKGLTAGTFHSFCARLLRERHRLLGLPRAFPICDAADQIAAVRAALRIVRVPETALHPRAAQARISLWKSRMAGPEEAAREAGDERDALAARAYAAYEAELRRRRALDFDDLLLRALRLLREHEEVRAGLEERYAYVMVDEYQDTNRPQYEIARAIAGKRRNLMAVGDDDQSIYAWRGADHRRILDFERDFPGAAVIRLETNYRSNEEILAAANKVIRNNLARHQKTLRSARGAGAAVEAFSCEDEAHEAQFVAAGVAEALRGGARPRDCAILFRTQTQPRPFETELRALGVPVRVSGAQSFFDRKEIRDLAAFLRLAARPHDEPALLRVVNVPPRGLGEQTVEKAVARAAAEGRDAGRVFAEMAAAGELPPAAARGWSALQEAMARVRAALKARRPLAEVAAELVEAVQYRAEVERCYPERAAFDTRWNGALEILDFAAAHERHRGAGAGIESFLDELALRGGEEGAADEREPADAVSLSTIHAAKGLEFERVWLVGLEEGILPHRRAALEGGVEEERRLMYVAVTRAKSRLTMTFCARRSLRGRLAARHPSRFLLELKEKPPPAGWVACERENLPEEPAEPGQPPMPTERRKARASGGRPRKARTDSSTGRAPPRS